MTRSKVDRYRPAGTRNYIATGDMVAVHPPVGGPFLGRIIRITAPADLNLDAVADLDVIELDVVVRKNVTKTKGTNIYPPHRRRGRCRTVLGSTISRVDQTLHPADEDPPTV